MSEKKQVGFIGLGTMGFSVASNLHEAGFEVVAFDVIEETRNEGEEQGFTIV